MLATSGGKPPIFVIETFHPPIGVGMHPSPQSTLFPHPWMFSPKSVTWSKNYWPPVQGRRPAQYDERTAINWPSVITKSPCPIDQGLFIFGNVSPLPWERVRVREFPRKLTCRSYYHCRESCPSPQPSPVGRGRMKSPCPIDTPRSRLPAINVNMSNAYREQEP